MKSLELLEQARSIKEQHPRSEVWADYVFLATCHAAAIDDQQRCNDLVTGIKAAFPKYKPLPRFSWGQLFVPDLKEPVEDQTLTERIRLIQLFVNQNPLFSFQKYFGNYFVVDSEAFFKNNR